MIQEENDELFSVKDGEYTIVTSADTFLLKRIYIRKKPLLYSFIGGMWYSKGLFSLDQDISLPYPFTTYYTTKIPDIIYRGVRCRSLYYVKMPLMILQYNDECIAVEFDPVIQLNGQEVFPFISLEENETTYIVSFYLFKTFYVKEKQYAWLGFGKKRKIELKLQPGDSFRFHVKSFVKKNWEDIVRSIVTRETPKRIDPHHPEEAFKHAQKALWRSYDHLTGVFLQLPWRDTPGFTFVNSSYSLIAYDAVRLHYFSEWYKKTGDKQFLEWRDTLRKVFINPSLSVKPVRGEGLVWYNMTNLTRHGLQGYFYMDCGYSGYPGGQATITFHLLKYLGYADDKHVERMVKQSLRYILSTQNKDGSWPMAIRQQGIVGLRPEKLDQYITYGGTGECIRALLQGFQRFNDERLKTAALNGLMFLETRHPLCVNGLRDIGLQEPEAFSAVSIIDAFLDFYEETKEKKYLKNALSYAYYSLTWFYLYDTDHLSLKFNFHPISYSITPRLSPYESLWIVSTYLRLARITGDTLWERIAKTSYNAAKKWVTQNGGLCEGVFPIYLSKLKPLPMEQTFATVELMRSSSQFFTVKKLIEKEKESTDDETIKIREDGSSVIIFYKNQKVFSFDVKKWKIVFIRNAKLNEYGISFSFYNPYSIGNRVSRFLKKYLRGRMGKFLLGLRDVKFFVKGVYGPKPYDKIGVNLIEKQKIKKVTVEVNGTKVKCSCETMLHRVSTTISACEKGKNLHVSFNPLLIEVLQHDLSCRQVLFPLIGCKLREQKNGTLCFDGFHVSGEFPRVVLTEMFTAVDQTLTTNWTHGGLYKGYFEVVLEDL